MCIQGRLEVHLRVERPDILGRRDILRIHARSMKANGALAADAQALIEDLEQGLPALTEYYSGAEIAGVVRSAASFALARNAAGVGAVCGRASANGGRGRGVGRVRRRSPFRDGAFEPCPSLLLLGPLPLLLIVAALGRAARIVARAVPSVSGVPSGAGAAHAVALGGSRPS